MARNLTALLLFTAAAACLLAATSAGPLTHRRQQQQHYYQTATQEQHLLQGDQQEDYSQLELTPKEKCNKLCENCGCHGYFCGDECICQCDYADNKNVKCLQGMRARSEKEAYPFEVLIQGPAGRRFVREATDIDPVQMAIYKQNERNGRSVYSIYKPNHVGKGGLMAAEDEGSDPQVGAAPFKRVFHGLADQRKIARERLESLRGKIGLLGSAHSENVGAAEPNVGAAADPTVGAPAPDASAAADPTVGSADPQVAAPAPDAAAADPQVGSSDPIVGSSGGEQVSAPAHGLWRNFPRIPTVAPPAWTRDLFKRFPLVGSGHLITQPDHTL